MGRVGRIEQMRQINDPFSGVEVARVELVVFTPSDEKGTVGQG